MKAIIILLFISCSPPNIPTAVTGDNTTALSHDQWDNLLKKHVSPDGNVDYKGFLQDREKLNVYLKHLSEQNPDESNWSKEESLAYWINAYNAFTVDLILRHYPLESIKDIKTINIPFVNSPWTIKFFSIGGTKCSLDQIEHKILRKKFDEPRIHFAINCASFSCPILKNEAFIPEKLEEQLNEQSIYFINNPDKNVIQEDQVQLSKIFSWFKGDFTKDGSLIDFLNRYSEVKISADAEIGYLGYDWKLNE